MNMFCYQCQETAHNTGCTVKGVCGKTSEVANLQDLLMFLLKGISYSTVELRKAGVEIPAYTNRFVMESLFMTITNANFDKERFVIRV
ncbi:MAG: hydroxylamine reductase, partial [Dysgonomonas mossii]|nr:hydroxylamine reductase [Dysgonomonas mossii]